ncbi:MAG: quinate 5-dehydrogenase, partial [Armatimonadetes bacterium]|nr:quinate 5-dehydrogenase [Armatimonadota bacterium]
LERRTIEYLHSNGIVDFSDKNVLVVCAVDRFGMAQSIAKLAKSVVYGDLMFSLGIPIPMRSYATVRWAAHAFLPLIVRLPFKWLYPTGKEQETSQPKYERYFRWADVIAGDWHIIRKRIPSAESGILDGKVVITNTLTSEDTQMMIDRGVRLFVTSTPQYDGRYYATNVYEGVLVTLLGKRPEEITASDYDDLLARLNWNPTVIDLKQTQEVN